MEKMEKDSFENAHNEAFEIQKNALEKKGQAEDLGDLSSEEYENEDKLIDGRRYNFFESLESLHSDMDSIVRRIENYHLPAEIIQEEVEKVFISLLQYQYNCYNDPSENSSENFDSIYRALEIKNAFNLPAEFVQEVARKAFAAYLGEGGISLSYGY